MGYNALWLAKDVYKIMTLDSSKYPLLSLVDEPAQLRDLRKINYLRLVKSYANTCLIQFRKVVVI